MPDPEIEAFARIIVRHIRDAAIRSNDAALRDDVSHAVGRRWREAASKGDPKELARVLIPDIVDDTVFYLLNAIDQGILQLSFTAPNGKTAELHEDGRGELGGWYMGSDGWRASYSEERVVDDFSDLK